MAAILSEQNLRILDELQEFVYLADADTHELLFVNRAAAHELGCSDHRGKKCFEVIEGLGAPCPFCNNDRLRAGELFCWDHYNERLGKSYQLQDKLIDCAGRRVRMEVAVDVTERENRQRELTAYLRTEKRLVGTMQMLNGPGTLDERLGKALRELGMYFAADRTCLFLLDEDGQTLSNTHEWCAPDVAPQRSSLQRQPLCGIGRWRPSFDRRQCLVTPDLEAIRETDPNEYAAMARRDIRSYVEAPVEIDGVFAGFLGVDNPAPEKLAHASEPLLSLACAVSNAIVRDKTERELIDSRTRYRLAVDGAKLAVWEYDLATKRMYLPEDMGAVAADRYGFRSRVIENVPDCMLPLGLTDADRENFLRLFDELRAGRENATADIWFRTDPEHEPRCERVSYYTRRDETGKPVRAYGVGADVTAVKLERIKFHQAIQTVLAANPEALCTFQINLTKNLCYEGHGASGYILASLQADTADGLFENAAAMTAGDDDRSRLRETFDRRKLLAGFAKGARSTHVDYRRLDESGRPFWVRTYIRLLKNPDSGDVEGAIYSLDISRERQQSEILRIITSQEYDLIALLHLDTGRFEAVYLGDTLPQGYRRLLRAPGDSCDFSELCSRAADEWIAPEERETYLRLKTFDAIRARLAHSRRYEFTMRERFPDIPGGEMYRRFQHYALQDDADTVLVIESDVTESWRRQQREIDAAKAETKRVTDILDSISSGICVLQMPDPEHLRISYVNQQMYRILGLEPSGNNLAEAAPETDSLVVSYTGDAFSGVHPDDLNRVRQTFRENFESTHFVVDNYRTRGADGNYFWLKEEVELREVTPEYRVFYATYNDVSEEVRLQNELENRLDREKTLRREATAASDAKSEFLSRMSHDIRTPLNGIIGMTYFAEKQENPPATKDCLAKIDTSSKFLLGLVNDILDMSKAESGRIELHPEPYRAEDFSAYLDAVVAPLCRDKNQKLIFEADTLPDAVPLMDALRVNQIFFNLLSNAIKYTPEGGTIRCTLRERLNADRRIALTAEIADNGIGMSADFQKVLFEPFMQEGRSDISESRGSGLGLAIVKKMVDLMGGTISVHSTVGEGTTFRICAEFEWVPAADVRRAVQREAADAPEQLAGCHILLCEDHPLNQEIARALLEEQKALVELADNGQSGAERFARSPVGYYDAILMDIRMPVMDGYESTARIRALDRPDAATVPIIAMTADAFSDDVQKCLSAGMNGHIAKPLDPRQMYETILAAIRRTKLPG